MEGKSGIYSLEAYGSKRIGMAKMGLFYAWISSVTMVVFSLFNSGAQEMVLNGLGSGGLWTTVIAALIVLGVCEFGAGIVIILYNLCTGMPLREYKSLWNMKASRIAFVSALAAGPGATCSLMIAITLCGVTYANSLLSLAPAVTAVAARFLFREHPVKRVYIGIGIAIFGIIVASYSPPEGAENFYLGILFACFAPVGFAIEAMLSARVMDLTDPLQVCSLYRCLGGGVLGMGIALILCLALGKAALFGQVFALAFSDGTILLYMLIATVFIAVEYGTIYVAYNYCGPTRGTAIIFSTPIWSIPIGYLLSSIFPYYVTPLGIVGAVVVVVGMLLIVMKPSELFNLRDID